MRNQDRLFSQVTWAVLPLLAWAAHFFYCYVHVSLAPGAGTAPLVASAVALALAALLLARAVYRVRLLGQPLHDNLPLMHWTTLAIAVLALIGMAWSCIPMLMLSA